MKLNDFILALINGDRKAVLDVSENQVYEWIRRATCRNAISPFGVAL